MKVGSFLIGLGLALLLVCCNPGSGPVRPDAATEDADGDQSDAAGDPDGADSGDPADGGDDSADGSETPDADADSGIDATDETGPLTGEFSLLTYNVAGLPAWLSGSDPVKNIPLISPLLNAYDLVLVQEDFWYHDELTADITHPHQSEPAVADPTLTDMGDGLNRFSKMPFDPVIRVTWEQCNGLVDCGSDCMTEKGFSVARVHLADGASLNVYNIHMDASDCDADFESREVQRLQLIADIATRSPDEAVIVTGDTNLKMKRPQDVIMLDQLLADTGFEIACRVLSCADETHDRVLYRSSPQLTLTPTSWSHPAEFVDSDGNDLSDHKPVKVNFSWEEP
jgi:endonuclease/exonuclease/phosphatase (EEP) superfamily protein YafD